jgi:F0F1-type ATP synthase assembly protein I
MVVAVFLGLYGGWWIDRRLGTFPVFMLLGIFLGIGIGFYNLWSELNELMGKKPEKESDRGNDERRE